MSRIGKLPIAIADNIEVIIEGCLVKVKGVKGSLEKKFSDLVSIEKKENNICVKPVNDTAEARAMWGTARSIINNMVVGVTEGFKEELEVNGVGYRAAIKGDYLNLSLGKSHNTKIEIPADIKVETPKQTIITFEAHDKQKLGQYVAIIRNQRPPEPYKGKGIRRKGEYVERKEGKKG